MILKTSNHEFFIKICRDSTIKNMYCSEEDWVWFPTPIWWLTFPPFQFQGSNTLFRTFPSSRPAYSTHIYINADKTLIHKNKSKTIAYEGYVDSPPIRSFPIPGCRHYVPLSPAVTHLLFQSAIKWIPEAETSHLASFNCHSLAFCSSGNTVSINSRSDPLLTRS